MAIIPLIPSNNVRMKALSALARQAIVWTSPVLIMWLMVNVSKKIVPPIHHRLVPVPSSAKPLAAVIVKNAVMILVLPVPDLIPVLMLQRQNAVTNVIIATLLARQVLLLLIPALLVLITNVAMLVKNVLPLVLRVA